MQSILCALDSTEASTNVLKVALKTAGIHHSSLTILFSYRLIQDNTNQNISDLKNTLEAKARKEFARLEKKVMVAKDTPYEFLTTIGFISDGIQMLLKKKPCQMIIMGQGLANTINKHKDLNFNIFIDEIAVPVLIVPEKLDRMVLAD